VDVSVTDLVPFAIFAAVMVASYPLVKRRHVASGQPPSELKQQYALIAVTVAAMIASLFLFDRAAFLVAVVCIGVAFTTAIVVHSRRSA
jgi:hypothetical protein